MADVRSDVLVIIPTYNEADNIGKLIDELMSRYPHHLDVLVIDDNSPDATADIVRTQKKRYGDRLHLIERERKQGLGTAYIAGFRYGLQRGYAFLAEMDADYSHDPAALEQMLQEARHYDLVIGSRYINNTVNVVNWPLARLVLSKTASMYTRWVTGLPVSDPTSGYKCFRADMLRKIDLHRVNSQGYSFQIEMNYRVWKLGGSLQEIPIIFIDRTVGQSKMSRKNIVEAVWIVWFLKAKSILRLL
ncbi:Dolichyl-phosphate beta-D-mannosyltransferase [Prosthecochloris aestuarii DSM 271]|uniref:Dolichyl-phosphate beta-D-mannosyltransferase n=1 Tax=Prosthecochloris aestuarii (strain DSM 271 / SK 413) TaxID=290512 RepID=B4S485_PROA2|nr:polyprenol monophosphomannose synthase [Prosthecochloris aestuarii]ACF45333.1 Dolichyl-phosphate beta-D-mannosyltransferase [Prosthecochloris aestuarii DSM 271]